MAKRRSHYDQMIEELRAKREYYYKESYALNARIGGLNDALQHLEDNRPKRKTRVKPTA